jgi:hypothetical protein
MQLHRLGNESTAKVEDIRETIKLDLFYIWRLYRQIWISETNMKQHRTYIQELYDNTNTPMLQGLHKQIMWMSRRHPQEEWI